MGTILYVILQLVGWIQHEDDLANICLLVSLDSIVVVMLLHLRVAMKKC